LKDIPENMHVHDVYLAVQMDLGLSLSFSNGEVILIEPGFIQVYIYGCTDPALLIIRIWLHYSAKYE